MKSNQSGSPLHFIFILNLFVCLFKKKKNKNEEENLHSGACATDHQSNGDTKAGMQLDLLIPF